MESIRCQKVLLVLLEHMIQLGVKIFNLLVLVSKELTYTSHVVEMAALWLTIGRLCGALYINGTVGYFLN